MILVQPSFTGLEQTSSSVADRAVEKVQSVIDDYALRFVVLGAIVSVIGASDWLKETPAGLPLAVSGGVMMAVGLIPILIRVI